MRRAFIPFCLFCAAAPAAAQTTMTTEGAVIMTETVIAPASSAGVVTGLAQEIPVITESRADADIIVDTQALNEAQADMLQGGRLLTNQEKDAYQAPDLGETEDVYVIEETHAKDSANWTKADDQACESAGGIVLPISAGRIACFKL